MIVSFPGQGAVWSIWERDYGRGSMVVYSIVNRTTQLLYKQLNEVEARIAVGVAIPGEYNQGENNTARETIELRQFTSPGLIP